MPSLAQLDQAVREFIGENPTDQVTVVVDASFGHRIDPAELADFEEAEAAGEVVSPPAGAIGRGDAFLLRIAEKTGATVLSNDSFQEFHGEHVWLFEKGRLLGGKPVPGVGWIFMDRTPVRGAKSREVTKEAKRKKRAEVEVVHKVSVEPKPKARSKAVDRAIARATEEVVEPKSGSKSRRRRSSSPPAEPVNEPLAFITFIAAHPLGSDVVGTVLEYSSHGAFVEADGARCYIPLSAMASPPPRRAREVVTKGEPRSFVVQAFDPPRRGIELALPGFAKVAGGPTAETLEAEISAEPEELEVLAGVGGGAGTNGAGVVPADAAPARPGGRRSGRKAAAPVEAVPGPIMGPGGPVAAPSGPVPEVDLRTSRPTEGAEERPAARKSRAKKEPAQEAVAERVPAESEEAPVRPARGRKPASEGAPVAEPAPAPKKGAVKATAERAATAKRAAMAKRSATGEAVQAEATLPDLTAGASRKAPARAAATKAPARAAATKAAARKAASAVPAAGKAASAVPAAGKAASAVPAAGRAAVKKAASAVPAAGKPAAGKAPATKVAAGKAASAVPARKPASAAGKPAARKAPATKAAAGKAASAVPAATKAAAGKAASAVPAAGKAAAGKAASAVPAARNAVGRKVAGPESGTGVGVEAGGPGASSPVRPARHGSSGG